MSSKHADAESIVLIGNYDDPIYHWFAKRFQDAGYTLGQWCLDDPAFEDLDLIAPAGRIVFNTTLDRPGFSLNAYLAAANMEGHAQPEIIFQNVLCETLFQSQSSTDEDYTWIGFSPFSLYGHFNEANTPAIELTALEPNDFDYAQNFLKTLQLDSVIAPNCPALVLGRIVAMLANEACSALMENVATPDAIDTAMRLGTHYPMGPLAWADAAGLNVILSILNHLHDIYKEPRYRPMRLLQEYVAIGRLGQAVGQGFHSYPQPVSI